MKGVHLHMLLRIPRPLCLGWRNGRGFQALRRRLLQRLLRRILRGWCPHLPGCSDTSIRLVCKIMCELPLYTIVHIKLKIGFLESLAWSVGGFLSSKCLYLLFFNVTPFFRITVSVRPIRIVCENFFSLDPAFFQCKYWWKSTNMGLLKILIKKTIPLNRTGIRLDLEGLVWFKNLQFQPLFISS